ncbi:MAG: type II toxin-antitoxin system HicB family antitoxin [Chloroflexota bacterium]|nr:type II toxin-antitoxin system HicB family antitoxin [Chloroflexota bacterium]MDE2682552.1 type II toxin-antitoxin system HicB family antitoxin [Chloroflexota bacterium]
MERTYLALIHKDPGSSFGVTFPDFPGCTSGGDTFEEAREMAREALALCLEGMAADGVHIPPPCPPDAALASEDADYAIALIVVEALPERTEEEAQAELEAFLASDEYREIYGDPLTEDELNDLPYYEDSFESEAVKAGIALRPVAGADADHIYAALVRQDAAGEFSVGFPDLPGCVAYGNTLEQTCKAARPALARHLANLATNGASIPNPSSASDVLAHPDAADTVALIVVEALTEREASLDSREYREVYGEPVSTV